MIRLRTGLFVWSRGFLGNEWVDQLFWKLVSERRIASASWPLSGTVPASHRKGKACHERIKTCDAPPYEERSALH